MFGTMESNNNNIESKKRSPVAVIYETVEEHPEPIDADVTGEVPSWLSGSLLRVGPGKYEWGDTKYKHWFDGESLIHKFEIKDGGKVQYSNRFLRSESYTEAEKRGCISMNSFATVAPPDPCKNIFARFFSYFAPPESFTDNCNVNVVNIKGQPVALTEVPTMWRFDPEDLSSVERLNVGEKLGGGMRGWLAHPHEDEEGNNYNFSATFVDAKINIVKIPDASDDNKESLDGMKVIGQFKPHSSKLPYYHSFGMTENYFILVENPLYMSNIATFALMKLMNWSYVDMFKEDLSKPSIISLIDRKTGKLARRYAADHFFVFHHINAYEDGDEIVMDLSGYDNGSIIQDLYLSNLRVEQIVLKGNPSALRRYRLPLAPSPGGDIPQVLPRGSDGLDYEYIFRGFELARINYSKFNTKRYKYAYGVAFRMQGLAKVNVETKESYAWRERGAVASEPVFVEAPDAKEEDDGVVLSMVIGLGGKKSFLLILDAKAFKEIARAEVQYQFSATLHGDFWCK